MLETLLSNRTVSVLWEALPRILSAGLTMTIPLTLVSFTLAMVLAVAVPIMLQNGLTNVVSLLDNLMVGRVGTDQMSGVSIVNQLIFIVYLSLFGGMAGAGIFTAQYYGQANHEGVRDTMRFKIIMVSIITLAAILIAAFGGD